MLHLAGADFRNTELAGRDIVHMLILEKAEARARYQKVFGISNSFK